MLRTTLALPRPSTLEQQEANAIVSLLRTARRSALECLTDITPILKLMDHDAGPGALRDRPTAPRVVGPH
jgi:hypothetical protein